MNARHINKYKNLCIMGLGKMYGECISDLEKHFHISYICDSNPSFADSEMALKYRFLRPVELQEIEDLFVIVTSSFENYIILDNQLTVLGIRNCYVLSIQDIGVSRPVIQLSKIIQSYEDKWGNFIELPRDTHFPRYSFVRFGDEANQPMHEGKSLNNRLHIGKNANLSQTFLIDFRDSDCYVNFGDDIYIRKIHVKVAQGASFRIGNRSSCEELYAILYEGGQIHIGEDCMFAHNIQLWQTDTHPIFDKTTGKRINKSKNITIGDHVWVGANTSLLGGASIGSGSIVGMNSSTSSKIPSNVIIAGNPARVIRDNVVWARDLLCLSDINTLHDCKDSVVMNLPEK